MKNLQKFNFKDLYVLDLANNHQGSVSHGTQIIQGCAEVVKKHAITHVMHLAAESHVDRSITGPGDFIHTNIVGTFHLLEACREVWAGGRDGKRFLRAVPPVAGRQGQAFDFRALCF